jgi:hypothetical protein
MSSINDEPPVAIIPYDEVRDYEEICKWWRLHKALPVPRIILPRGWIAVGSGLPMCVCFLYMDPGKLAMLEYMTTNPQIALSRELLSAVKALYVYMEDRAAEAGCVAILSMVKPGTSEERILLKTGWATSDQDPHKMYAKPLRNQENWHPPVDGVLKECPSPL